MSKNDVASLDDLIRAKAEKALRSELKPIFAEVSTYFPDYNETRELRLPESSPVARLEIDPQNEDHSVIVITVPNLLKALQERAFELSKVTRGNDAVREFLTRIESVQEELEELRSGVAE